MDPDNLLALRQIAAIHIDGDHLPIAWPTADERQRSRMFRVTTGDDLGCFGVNRGDGPRLRRQVRRTQPGGPAKPTHIQAVRQD